MARRGALEEDLRDNFAPDVVVLSGYGVHSGHDGMRHLAELFSRQLPDASYGYRTVLVDGELGFLEWTATGRQARIRDGADSYLIRDGRIVAQTIHYTVERIDGGGER